MSILQNILELNQPDRESADDTLRFDLSANVYHLISESVQSHTNLTCY